MSGHSQFANIKHRKGAQDSKRAKTFIKIIKEITIAVKSKGSDINSNPTLRVAVMKAKANNMPKDNYLKAIKKASKIDSNIKYNEVRYEGYGPGGIAYVIECLTDNNNRTSAKIRSYFNKTNGALGQTNSVIFLFEKKGLIGFFDNKLKEEEVFEWVIKNDCENLEIDDQKFLITCQPDKFEKMQDFLIEKNITDFFISEIKWLPNETIDINQEDLKTNKYLFNLLIADDDIKNVFSNLNLK